VAAISVGDWGTFSGNQKSSVWGGTDEPLPRGVWGLATRVNFENYLNAVEIFGI